MTINANNKCIDDIFGNTKYYLDFYQRDYKWIKEHITSLLEDIFYLFNNEYDEEKDVTIEYISNFGWYYLNTYVTDEDKGKIFIVDGQQRFVTLTLILIKLYHMAKNFGLNEKLNLIQTKIFGPSIEEGNIFWMGTDNKRVIVLNDLYENFEKTMEIENEDMSIKNIYQNFSYINEYLDKEITNSKKFEAFLIYFLKRILAIEIRIDNSDDVAMVFEVINDRGEKLKPYEVFKGLLLGQLDKNEVDQYYNIWTSNIVNLQIINESEVDNFFRYYFRSKYVDNDIDYRDFEGEYQRAVFSIKWDDIFKLKRNPYKIKEFIKGDFDYYSKLYNKLMKKKNDSKSNLFFNDLNDQDRQYLLILSSINNSDEFEEKKVELVSFLFDRHFTLLQLMGCYDSNYFTDVILMLNKNIRDKSLDKIKEIFNYQLVEDINFKKKLKLDNPFDWNLFKEASINNMGNRFIRYFFSRIEHFISKETNIPVDNYYNLVRNTGPKFGYHVEHIIADNDENRRLFKNDEVLFNSERNKLGAILLLQSGTNASSQNETYEGKLMTYSHATLWARTLTEDFYHSHPDFQKFIKKYSLNFRPILNNYNSEHIEGRQKILFEILKIIWADQNTEIIINR